MYIIKVQYNVIALILLYLLTYAIEEWNRPFHVTNFFFYKMYLFDTFKNIVQINKNMVDAFFIIWIEHVSYVNPFKFKTPLSIFLKCMFDI